MTNEERLHRASLAQSVLTNDAFIEAINKLGETYIEAWKNAATMEAREEAHRYYKNCQHFASDLKAMIFDGELTAKRINEIEGVKRRSW